MTTNRRDQRVRKTGVLWALIGVAVGIASIVIGLKLADVADGWYAASLAIVPFSIGLVMVMIGHFAVGYSSSPPDSDGD